MRRIVICAAAVLAASAATAAPNPGHGKQLYEAYCTQCHGVSGHGDGINAAELSVQPRNHTDQDEMGARTDEDLFKAIKEGGQAVNKSVLMPNWDGNLNDGDIGDIVAYLRELCCKEGN